jgi:hypothetical protein
MKQRAEIHRLTELWFNMHLMSTDNFSVGHHGLYSWEKPELYSRLSLLLLLGHQFLETLLLFLQPTFQCPETKLHKLIHERKPSVERWVWRDIVFCFQRWIFIMWSTSEHLSMKMQIPHHQQFTTNRLASSADHI